MPVTKSAQKALRGSQRKRRVNLATIRKYKEAVKSVKTALVSGKTDDAKKQLSNAYKALDKAAKKRVIHKNKANRLKSRLSKASSPQAK